MIVHPQQIAITAGMAGLVAWRLSVRIRRLVTRQRLSVRRQWTTAVVFSLLPLALLPGIEAAHASLWPLFTGLALGIALGLAGLYLTAFERDHTGHHYRPNAYIGTAIAVLFVLRLGYRLLETGAFGVSAAGATTPQQAPHLDPLTLGMIGLIAGFFATQAIGLLVWYNQRGATAERG
ncbi:MAG: hypothetical protein WBL23_12100 [Salinisphaera sp.]|uniref:hypothetical protein n=1 Tax=Salinisphaera sp. TaxID=1914330 RepID=UPI003C7A00C5